MDFENDFWSLIADHGSVAGYYKNECLDLWSRLTPQQQEAICAAISYKLRTGGFVHFNPVKAMKDNLPKPPRRQILTADEYYKRFGTTDPVNGWQKIYLPDQQKTIYVKN